MESFMMLCMVCASPALYCNPDMTNRVAIAKTIEYVAQTPNREFTEGYYASSAQYFYTIGMGNMPQVLKAEEYIDIRSAVEHFTNNIRKNRGKLADNYLLRSLAHANIGNHTLSLADMEKADSIFDSKGSVYHLMIKSNAHFAMGNYSAAIEICKQILALSPNQPQSLELLSMAYYFAGKQSDASSTLLQLCTTPGKKHAFANSLLLLLANHDLDNLKLQCNRFEKLYGAHHQVLQLCKSDLYYYAGNYEQAAISANTALLLPGLMQLQHKETTLDVYCQSLYMLKQYKQLAVIADYFTRCMPSKSRGYYYKAKSLLETANHKAAISAYNKALIFEPLNDRYKYEQGMLLAASYDATARNVTHATEIADGILKIDSKSHCGLTLKAFICAELGKWDEAEQYIYLAINNCNSDVDKRRYESLREMYRRHEKYVIE